MFRQVLPVLALALAGVSSVSAVVVPAVRETVAGVDSARLAAVIQKLVGFGTRDSNGVIDTQEKGVRAAREWIASEFRNASPRLQVRFDPHPVKRGGRILKDMEIVNVVAVLPGDSDPATQIVIGAHYDSLSIKLRAGSRQWDMDATASTALAPGASDNASGVACVLELARVLSQHNWNKTIVFIAFAGEEQGLFGAKGYAERAAREKATIEAVFNVDTIGTEVTGNGIPAGNRLNLYSDEPGDGPSRTLARFIRETSSLYLPELEMNAVFRADRFGRGGDHTPFHQAGFAAVRFTTPAEQLEHQHNERDTFDRISVRYVALATRGIGAALAALAAAPAAPVLSPLARGESGYDAVLRWKPPASGPAPTAYSVWMRRSTSPFWEREFRVGAGTELTLKNVSIDEWTFGVRAIGANGAEGLVRPWTLPPSRFTAPSTSPSPAN